MAADIGADVDHGVTGPTKAQQQVELRFAPLAITIERTPDKAVVAIEHEHAMSAPLDRDEAVFQKVV